MEPVDLNKLRTFLGIVDSGGVSAAARRQGLTRSAVSQSLKALESSLGLRLFHRVGRRLVLTPEGRTLHSRFREFHAQLADTLETLGQDEREVQGLVRLGLFLGFSRARLAAVVTAFTTRHANAGIRLRVADQDELDDALLEGRLDFVLSLGPRRRAHPRIHSTRLLREELILVSGRRPVPTPFKPSDLRSTPIIDYYQSDPLIGRWARHHFGSKARGFDVRVWAAATDLVLDLVLARHGMGVVPRHVARPHLAKGRLQIIETGRPELSDHVWLNEIESSHRSARERAFRTILLEQLAGGG